jgi:hypothetical protein
MGVFNVRRCKAERMALYKTLRHDFYKLRSELRKSHRNIKNARRDICHHFPIPEDTTENVATFNELKMPAFCANASFILH